MKKKQTNKDKFYKNGFIIFKNFFNKKEINSFEKYLLKTYSKHLQVKLNKKNIHSIIAGIEKKKKYDLLYKALKDYNDTLPFKEASKKLIKFSKKFFNNDYKNVASGMAIGINNSKRTAYKWHQEKPYYKKISTIHNQFPIFNACNLKNGTMSVLTGSHKIGFIKKVKIVKLSKKSINSFVPKNITALKKKYSEKFINLNLRDVVLFNENIIHKTNNNISNKIRFACIIRFTEIIDKVTK